MTNIHAIILTLNEERHIARCIESLGDQCASVTVVDSGSSDRTVAIAESLGATVHFNPWTNYATQMNFAVDLLVSAGGWLLRIDADEVLDPDGTQNLSDAVAAADPEVMGIMVSRRIHFLGKRIRHGGVEPSWQLRIWRNGKGRCEQRWMDEHIVVEGKVDRSQVVLSDINLNSLTWWTDKHNSYASREAIDQLNGRFGFLPHARPGLQGASRQARMRRFAKERIYHKMPAGLRSVGYFLYRYIVRLGILDGGPGFYFHLMQGLWYRTLVDAKVAEIVRHAEQRNISIPEAIAELTGIDPLAG